MTVAHARSTVEGRAVDRVEPGRPAGASAVGRRRTGRAVRAVSPVYETDAWGGVEQGPFLNAVLIADDPQADAHGWLRRAHELETRSRAGARSAMGAADPRRRSRHLS